MGADETQRLRWLTLWSKDAGALLVSQLGVTVMTASLSVILARSLGTSQFGTFSAFLGVSQAASLAIDLGIATWLLRELSAIWSNVEESHEAKATRAVSMLYGALRVNVRMGAVVIMVTLSAGLAAGESAKLMALAEGLMAYVVLIAMATAVEAGLRARRRIGMVMVTNAVEKAVLVASVGTVLVVHLGVGALGGAYVLAGVCRLAIGYSAAVAGMPQRNAVPQTAVTGVLRACAPFTMNSAALVLTPRLMVPVIALLSLRSAANFAIGYQIFTTLVLIPVIGSSALYPHVAKLRATISMQRVAAGFAAAGVAIAGCGIAVAPVAVPLVFGSRYTDAVAVTQLLLLALPLVFYQNGLMVDGYSGRLEREMLWCNFPGAIVGTAAVIVGQLTLGPSGAAAGFAFMYLVFVLSLLALLRRKRREHIVAATCPGK